jgi:hypothetical protein
MKCFINAVILFACLSANIALANVADMRQTKPIHQKEGLYNNYHCRDHSHGIFPTQNKARRTRSAPENPDEFIQRNLRLPAFNNIQSNGEFDLEVTEGSYGQTIEVSGSRRNLAATKLYVRGSTLQISTLCCAAPRRPRIRIHVPQLAGLACTRGCSTIRVNGLRSDHPVAFEFLSNSTVVLNGHVAIDHLLAGSNSYVVAYWIESCESYIKARGNATITLGGKVDTLVIDVWDNAQVDACQVWARRAFVKTFNRSRADIRVFESMNIVASDCSNVYYYQDPCFQAPLLQGAGSVIKMTRICNPPCWICDNSCCKNSWH